MISFSGTHAAPFGPVLTPEFLQSLVQPAPSKLLLFVLDGLGGLPRTLDGQTELETAHSPNLDQFAAEGVTGLSLPVGPGITPGSGPGHLALFGYDPIATNIGRGALSALGLGIELGPGDLAIRLNFCTLAADGTIVDRRAGRIETSVNERLVAELNTMQVDGVTVQFATESQHRAALIVRGDDLSPSVRETDPQTTGVRPREPDPLTPEAGHTSAILRDILDQVRNKIGADSPANFVLMRGYAGLPTLPGFPDLYRLRAACIASYPMYKGLARVAAMEIIETGDTLEGQFDALERVWDDFDFFFFHVKPTDSLAEDGDFDGKAAYIGQVDVLLPRVAALAPDVLVVTGDHSTPATLRLHSWHPVPCLLHGNHVAPDNARTFGERACAAGSLGVFPAQSILTLMLAHGGRLMKFGA